MAQSYRVIDFTSNSANVIFDYVIKPDNNIIYRSFKAARCAANSRVKSYLGADAHVPAELTFKQNQKKECDTNSNLHLIVNLPGMAGVQAMVMIVPVNPFKGDLPEEMPVRRSERVGRKPIKPDYVEVADSDSDSESDFVAVRRPAVKKEKVKSEDLAAAAAADGVLPGIMSALAINYAGGGGAGGPYGEQSYGEDPISYPSPSIAMMQDDDL